MSDEKPVEETGRKGGGDSGGGAYPNPHTGKKPRHGPFDHGGQTEIFEKQPGKTIDVSKA